MTLGKNENLAPQKSLYKNWQGLFVNKVGDTKHHSNAMAVIFSVLFTFLSVYCLFVMD